jgi:hypothetical protein
MEPEDSLPSSQEPSSCPYREPDQSNPYHPVLSLRSIFILPTHVFVFVFPVASYLLPFTPISYMHSHYLPFVLHALPLSSSLTWSFYLAKCTSYEAPHYAVFSKLLSRLVSLVQIFSSAPCSKTPLVYVPPLMSVTKFHSNFYVLDCRWEDKSFWTAWQQIHIYISVNTIFLNTNIFFSSRALDRNVHLFKYATKLFHKECLQFLNILTHILTKRVTCYQYTNWCRWIQLASPNPVVCILLALHIPHTAVNDSQIQQIYTITQQWNSL